MEATPQEIDITKLAISPISEPMASEKLTSKAIGLVSKLAKVKLIKRGVKEVNKFFRRKENKKQKVFAFLQEMSPQLTLSVIYQFYAKRTKFLISTFPHVKLSEQPLRQSALLLLLFW